MERDDGTGKGEKERINTNNESNRSGLCVFGHEQSLQEIYLRPVEIALQNCNERACTAIMSSYN